MTEDNQRSRDLKRAALLRERIIGALKAAVEPMSIKDLCGMSGIVELYHARLLPQKIAAQLPALVKTQVAKKAARGLWEYNRAQPEQAAPVTPLHDLSIKVDKVKKALTLTFEGLRITIEVA